MKHTATHCNTLQHTATHCSTLQHTAAHCSTLQHAQHDAHIKHNNSQGSSGQKRLRVEAPLPPQPHDSPAVASRAAADRESDPHRYDKTKNKLIADVFRMYEENHNNNAISKSERNVLRCTNLMRTLLH